MHRWSMLRSIIPIGITIQKTIALVSTLARLHNFCIDYDDDTSVPQTLGQDAANMLSNANGYVELEEDMEANGPTPRPLLDGGNHFDDVPWDSRRNRTGAMLPRTVMLQKVIDSHQVRPSAA